MIRTLAVFVLVSAALAGCGESRGTTQVTAPPSPALEQGKSIVKANCFVCHGQGINGAPIIGNINMWGPRVSQGVDTLVEHALSGYNMMPAKGGNESLGEEEVRLAVEYMLSQLPE